MTLKIAAVPYCNAFPLIHFLPELLPDAVIAECLPSEMRGQLTEGKLDLALMPVAELIPLPQGKIISNCCIACNGAVRSVLLFSKKPIESIRTIALDTASRSSVKICEVILKHFYHIQPKKYRLEQDQNPSESLAEAFLLIGDRALAYQPENDWRYRYDIGELWQEHTELPLVFAAWIACSPKIIENSEIASALETSRDRGLLQLQTVLDLKERQGIVLPQKKELILDYYRHAIIYNLGEQERASMQFFFEHCR